MMPSFLFASWQLLARLLCALCMHARALSRASVAALATCAFFAFVAMSGKAHGAPDKAQLVQLLKLLDERLNSQGDYQAELYINTKESGKEPTTFGAFVFRRAADQRFMLLFTHPKNFQGQGYLRADRNLWFYDPSVGRWERKTERERIGGTNSRRSDFDEARLADEYDATDDGEETLGAYTAQVLTLRGKPDVDVAFPVVKLWVDSKTKNLLKRQEFALSGRLLRTAYFAKWKRIYSESKKGDVWYPEESHYFDEIEKGDSTLVLVKSVDLRPLEANLFTKAWFESKSR